MDNKVVNISISFFKKNFFLLILGMISLGLVAVQHLPPGQFSSFVDWDTIVALTGLLLITMGVKESIFFYIIALRISRQIGNERTLAFFLVFVSAGLSIFLTNDIALFIIVPLTLNLQEISVADYTKLIVFEAIAVNVGSALTAIGNPQNIFLWHRWNISFLQFTQEMAPLVFVLSFYRRIVFKTNWGLIFLFILLFIDIHLICQAKTVQALLTRMDFTNARTLFLTSSLLSQLVSNVPATILLSGYSSNFKTIAYGVNIAGNGLMIGSFANLIALGFIHDKSKYFIFHLYSLSYFILTLFFPWYFLF